MALPRLNDFPDRDLKIADLAKALSHPARVAILNALAEKKDCVCGDLVADLPLAQSSVSQHLKVLKEVGLIKGTIDGPRSRYCIDWTAYLNLEKEFSQWTNQLIKLRRSNNC